MAKMFGIMGLGVLMMDLRDGYRDILGIQETDAAPRYVSGEGSIISQAPDLYRPGRNVVVPTPAQVVPINPQPPGGGGGGNPPPQG